VHQRITDTSCYQINKNRSKVSDRKPNCKRQAIKCAQSLGVCTESRGAAVVRATAYAKSRASMIDTLHVGLRRHGYTSL